MLHDSPRFLLLWTVSPPLCIVLAANHPAYVLYAPSPLTSSPVDLRESPITTNLRISSGLPMVPDFSVSVCVVYLRAFVGATSSGTSRT